MPARLSKHRYEERRQYYAKHRRGAFRSGFSWTTRETDLILTSSLGDVELSRKIGRSVEAIQVKRCKLLALTKR